VFLSGLAPVLRTSIPARRDSQKIYSMATSIPSDCRCHLRFKANRIDGPPLCLGSSYGLDACRFMGSTDSRPQTTLSSSDSPSADCRCRLRQEALRISISKGPRTVPLAKNSVPNSNSNRWHAEQGQPSLDSCACNPTFPSPFFASRG